MNRRTVLEGLAASWLGWVSGTAWAAPPAGTGPSSFLAVYGDPVLRDRFFLFLQNIFHLYPEAEFHQAIIELCAVNTDDAVIYAKLQERLAEIKPLTADVTYAIPALAVQKQAMAQESAALLAGLDRIDGYVEIGTTGRYVGSLREVLPLKGKVVVVNDVAPGYGPVDLLERGQVRKAGKFVPLGDYDPLPPDVVPDASVDLVSSFIGFHHCPPDRLDGFVDSVKRVLRPGGSLLLREHDVDDAEMDTFVALAHDVFNAGVAVSWADNCKQIRAFRSVSDWTARLEAAGFRRQSGAERQDHDPTDNTLLAFVRA